MVEDSMTRSLFSFAKHGTPIAALALTLAVCAEPAAPARGGHSHAPASGAQRSLTPEAYAQLAELRALTASFHSIEAAAKAGWNTKITDCFSDPNLGGMGFHYGNTALIDGAVDPLQPELLLYEPRKNGERRLVAVEYIVPFTAWTSANPPVLFGQPFHRNEAFGLWVLHVWHFNNNPSGIFSDWNPDVSCAYAE
jgi:hypothetical protein